MGQEITAFSILPLIKQNPLLLRNVHFRHDHLPSTRFDLWPSSEFDYDVFDGENVVGRIYFKDEITGARWFWSISAWVVRDEDGASGWAESLSKAKIAFAAAWEQARESRDS